jgi:hypothetical protein
MVPLTIENRQTAYWHSLLALFWLSCYAASNHLVVAPQPGAKDHFLKSHYMKPNYKVLSKKIACFVPDYSAVILVAKMCTNPQYNLSRLDFYG